MTGHQNGEAKEIRIKVGTTSSKQDEIQALTKIAAGLPSETYLHSLFSNDLVEWATYKILDDIAPDVFDHLQLAKKDYQCATAFRKAETTRAAQAAKETARLEDVLDQATEGQASLQKTHAATVERMTLEMNHMRELLTAAESNAADIRDGVSTITANAFLADEQVKPEQLRDALRDAAINVKGRAMNIRNWRRPRGQPGMLSSIAEKKKETATTSQD
jgi:hypothetical protein